MHRLSVCFLILLLTTLALPQPYTLRHSPKVGDVTKYRLSIIFTLTGGDVVYSAVLTDKVIQVEKDGGFSVETTQSQISGTSSDRDLSIDMKNAPRTITDYGSKGEIIKLRADQPPEAWRLANLTAFHLPEKPLSIGDSWKAEIPTDSLRNTPSASVSYKLESSAKIGERDALVILQDYKEDLDSNPASSTGKLWVDLVTGNVLKAAVEWRNAPLLGLATMVNATVTYEVIP